MPSMLPPIDSTPGPSTFEPRATPRNKPADTGGSSFDAVLSDHQNKLKATPASADDDALDAGKASADSAASDSPAPTKAGKPVGNKGHRAEQKDKDVSSSQKTGEEAKAGELESEEVATNDDDGAAALPSPPDVFASSREKTEQPHDAAAKTDPLVSPLVTQSAAQDQLAPVKAIGERTARRPTQQKNSAIASAGEAEPAPARAEAATADELATATTTTDASAAATENEAPASGKKLKAFAVRLGDTHGDDDLPADGQQIKTQGAHHPSSTASTPADLSTVDLAGGLTQGGTLDARASESTDEADEVTGAGVAPDVAAPNASRSTAAVQKLQPAAPSDSSGSTAEARFADANHANIVSAVHADLLPNGGTMKLRLDPPELGALHVTVAVRDGVISANFHASTEQAARLLSHSLGDLKSMLETQGVSVEKLHVTQAPRSENASSNSNSDSQGQGDGRGRGDEGSDNESTRRDQQRQEMLRKMWARLSGKQPLDMVA